MVPADTNPYDSGLDYRGDAHERDQTTCGHLCHVSLMSVAGLASYAVYNGLATENFISRRIDDISDSKSKIYTLENYRVARFALINYLEN